MQNMNKISIVANQCQLTYLHEKNETEGKLLI